MCSINSCYDELKVDDRTESLVGAQCRKCNENSARIVLQRKFPYCKECFLIYFCHKYSSGLGKSKLLKYGDKVLVAFSGSPYSICLLDLIFRSLVDDRKKRVRFDVEILFIDERPNISKNERCQLHQSIEKLISNYGYKVHYTVLSPFDNEAVLLTNSDQFNDFNMETDLALSDVKSESIRQDLVSRLRDDVLYRAAKKLKCNKIFTAETSDHISSSILSNLALGRGKQMASITGMFDIRKDVMIIRPLRECSKKEVIFYNIFNKLCYSSLIIDFEKDKFSSIQKLSEIFVSELQFSFPSTVSTVISTGNKLSLNNNKTAACCFLCHALLDSETYQLSALDALRVSNIVSNSGSEDLKNILLTPIENGSCYKSETPGNEEALPKLLCHSCTEIYKESKHMKNDWLKRNIFELNMESMHSDIKDFLIE